MLPDEPLPVRLMSTIHADTDGIHDELRTPADVDAWLDAAGVDRAGTPATTSELAKARALRDAVRRLAAHVTGDSRQAAASARTACRRRSRNAMPSPRRSARPTGSAS